MTRRKIMLNRKIFSASLVFIILLSGIYPSLLFSQERQKAFSSFTPAKILFFAESLFNEKDYFRAEGEYLRYLYLSPVSGRTDSVRLKIALCRIKRNQFALAAESLDKLIIDRKYSRLHSSAFTQKVYSYYLDKRYSDIQGLHSASDSPSFEMNPPDYERIQLLRGMSGIQLNKWEAAEKIFGRIKISNKNGNINYDWLRDICRTAGTAPRKNPWIAGFASALIPGLGRIYNKRYGDGVFSFFTVGLCAFASYNAFDNDKDIAGYTTGLAAGILYAGNVYGSAMGALIHNRRQNKMFVDSANQIVTETKLHNLFELNIPLK